MRTYTFSVHNSEELTPCLSNIIKEDFCPTLAIIFTSPKHDIKDIQIAFSAFDIDIFGCSSAGEIINDTVEEYCIGVMLLEIPRSDYKIQFATNQISTFETASGLANLIKNSFPYPAALIASGKVIIDAEQIVYGLKSVLNSSVPIFGGLAGDDLNLIETTVFSNNNISNDGLIALVFDNTKIAMNGMATSGWEAIGLEHEITKAEGNILYAINNEPAHEVFIKYFGFHDNANVKGKPVSTISAQYPLQVIREDGYVVLRTPAMADEENGSLILLGEVKVGDKFRFSIAPGFEVIDKTILEYSYFQQQKPAADALILFSCKGRHAALGPLIEDEVKGIHSLWNVPMLGFFSYGEIGNLEGKPFDFHNETCCLVTLKTL